MKQCSLCLNKEAEETITLLESSCNHYICTECRYKEVIYNHEKVIKTTSQQEMIDITCIICANFNYSLNNTQIYDRLKQMKNSSDNSLKCGGLCQGQNDDSVVKIYCKDCRIYLCLTCFTNHSTDHEITSKLNQNFNSLCLIHRDETLKFECKNCSIPLCVICKEIEHNEHQITYIKGVYTEKIEKIKSNLPFTKYENLCEYLDKEKQEIYYKLNMELYLHSGIFEKLISKIQDMIFSFKNDIGELKENLEISIKNMKISFQRFYKDLENIQGDDYFNINSLLKISFKKFEFFNRDNINDSLNNCISLLYSKFNNQKNEIKIDGYVKKLNKLCSFKLENTCMGILELAEGTLACWTSGSINMIKFNPNNQSLETVKTLPFKTPKGWGFISPIQVEDKIVFTNGRKEIRIWDKDFNLTQSIRESNIIYSLCSISPSSFAVGVEKGPVKIYSRNVDTKIFQLDKEFKDHSDNVYCVLYVNKHDFLLSGSSDKTINVFKLTEGKSIKKITEHNKSVFSLISIDEDTFANSSFDGIIKIWFINADSTIECVNIIQAYNEDSSVYIKLLANDLIMSYLIDKNEFKILNLKTNKEKNYTDDSGIIRMIVTKNNSFLFITYTSDKKLNVWRISE